MFNTMSQLNFLALAKQHQRIVIHQTLPSDCCTPISAYFALKQQMVGATILESVSQDADLGRYSYLGFDAYGKISLSQQQLVIEDRITNSQQIRCGAPLPLLRQALAELQAYRDPQLHGFVGGAVGYFNYDAVRLFEAIPDRHQQADDPPPVVMQCYRHNLLFDHHRGLLTVATVVLVGNDPKQDYQQAQQQLGQLIIQLKQPPSQVRQVPTASSTTSPSNSEISIDIDDAAFAELVKQAKQAIIDGEVFQVVLSRCFKQRFTASPIDIYRALRIVSPAPYLFFIDQGDAVITGASPENLVRVQAGQVSVMPIAGTRRRGQAGDDAELTKQLLDDDKEVAEHMMLVDLARNDVGAVAQPGSVKISQLKQPVKYSHVIHLVSQVQGQCRQDKDALDCLASAFPTGTLSGAPKIRAMALIDQLETSRRGLYGGGIVIVDGAGNLESCIAIRMAVLKNGVATVRTGAGIVFDSVPEKEAEETKHKASAVLEAIALAERGLP